MKSFTKASFWLGLLEQLVYICPTLITVLYFYFTEIRKTVELPSQYCFGIAVALFVLLLIYKHFAKVKLEELRQSVVQTETDLKNEPPANVEKRRILAVNARKSRTKLDILDRAQILMVLVIFALAVYILERASVGLTMLAAIACVSVAAGALLHLVVLKLKEKEAVKIVYLKSAAAEAVGGKEQ